jgi:hypothetical protein
MGNGSCIYSGAQLDSSILHLICQGSELCLPRVCKPFLTLHMTEATLINTTPTMGHRGY